MCQFDSAIFSYDTPLNSPTDIKPDIEVCTGSSWMGRYENMHYKSTEEFDMQKCILSPIFP